MNTFYISFDDTDNLDSPGTGHLLQNFLNSLVDQKTSYISRHQLFFSPDVPYTSHNSSMCSIVEGNIEYEELIEKASQFLKDSLAEGADPGLCVADKSKLIFPELLVNWGYRAKKEVLSKREAYELAKLCKVHLSEHGGTGQGVVGSLAGVGLRIAGQDGRVKGKKEVKNEAITVQELLMATGFDRVVSYMDGELSDDVIIHTDGNLIKAVYQNFQSTVLVTPEDGEYHLLSKDMIKCF